MNRVNIEENLKGKKLRDFMLFAKEISDKISVCRYYNGMLSSDEFNQIQEEYKRMIIEEDKDYRIKFIDNFEYNKSKFPIYVNSKEDASVYLDKVLDQNLKSYDYVKYEDFINPKQERFDKNRPDFLYMNYTRNTPVTRSPVFEVIYFSIGNTLLETINKLNSLYDFPYKINNYEFEDLCFYKGNRIVLAICSHENFAYMNLDDKENLEFMKLNILSSHT